MAMKGAQVKTRVEVEIVVSIPERIPEGREKEYAYKLVEKKILEIPGAQIKEKKVLFPKELRHLQSN